MISLVAIFALAAATVACLVLCFYDPVRAGVDGYVHQKTSWATQELDQMFVDIAPKRLHLWFLVGPMAGSCIGWIMLRSLVGLGAGAAIGLVVPQLYIMRMKAKRRNQFGSQLVDALMLMSSSLKAGLSILQAFEVIVEEMPKPIAEEFGLMLKENKMGVPFHESLLRLKRRIPSDDLNLIVTALLVARETGGDVTQIFTRLIDTIRERRKLKEKVKTLTVQGRLQGYLMMGLPVVFAIMARQFNPQYFDIFFSDTVGRFLLMLALILEVVGALLIMLFSRVRI